MKDGDLKTLPRENTPRVLAGAGFIGRTVAVSIRKSDGLFSIYHYIIHDVNKNWPPPLKFIGHSAILSSWTTRKG